MCFDQPQIIDRTLYSTEWLGLLLCINVLFYGTVNATRYSMCCHERITWFYIFPSEHVARVTPVFSSSMHYPAVEVRLAMHMQTNFNTKGRLHFFFFFQVNQDHCQTTYSNKGLFTPEYMTYRGHCMYFDGLSSPWHPFRSYIFSVTRVHHYSVHFSSEARTSIFLLSLLSIHLYCGLAVSQRVTPIYTCTVGNM